VAVCTGWSKDPIGLFAREASWSAPVKAIFSLFPIPLNDVMNEFVQKMYSL